MNGLVIVTVLLFVMLLLIGLVLFKEVRTHRFWRRLIADNDMEAIGQILDGEIEHWRTMRPPKGISASVWSGVQGMELTYGDARIVHVSTSAEAEFRHVQGVRTQVASALDGAFLIAARLVEMLLYEVPILRPERVRVDVNTTFRGVDGSAVSRPIISVTAERAVAGVQDWDNESARVIVSEFAPLYRLNDRGEALPISLPAAVGEAGEPTVAREQPTTMAD